MPRSRRPAARLAGTNTVPSLSHLQSNTMGISFIPCHWDSPPWLHEHQSPWSLERHNHPEQGGSPSSTAWSWCVPEGTGGNAVIREQSHHPAQCWGSRKLQPLRTESGLQTSPEQASSQRFIYSWLLRGFPALVLVKSREHNLSLTTLPLLGPSSSQPCVSSLWAVWCSEGTRGSAEIGG